MPNLSNIVCSLNDSIKKGTLTGQPFQNVKMHNIAYYRENTDKKGWICPMIVDNDDNCFFVSPDDDYGITSYHMVDSPSYDLPKYKADFGNPGTWLDAVYKMRMVVFCDRSKIKVKVEDLCDMMVYYLPREFSNTQLQQWGLTNVDLTTDGVNIDSKSVFSNEFKNVDYTLKNTQFMFWINYTLIITYSGNCFNLCNALNTK